ncbi:MAG: DEAD/DEAH box helicase [Thermoproteales archaeon]|nr:DEAD/DEAH box helicase [Thermoproteales archaeon]
MDVLEALHPYIRKLWLEKGFGALTPPQVDAIPHVLSGENVLIVAPTGTGKTEAAFLPILSKLLDEEKKGIKIIYITPLRTLNRDLLNRLEWWTLKLDLRIAVRHGDTSMSERRVQALKPPDIMITTPETFQLLLIGERLKQHIQGLKWVIVDEVHEVADSKRGVQLALLLEKARKMTGRVFQLIGLSATVGNPEGVAEFLSGVGRKCRVVYTPVAKLFEVKVAWPDVKGEDYILAEKLMVSESLAARLRYIREAVEKYGSVLIFSNTRPTVEMLGSRLKLWDIKFPVYVHHGSLSQEERIRIEDMLRAGKIKGVVCTSSMELGIDIGHVDFVIQYNSPREVRRLIQRIGRSGHGIGRVSKGVVLVGDSDDALEAIVLVNLLKLEKIEPSIPPRKPFDVLAHEIVGFALTGLYTPEEIYELARKTVPYRNLEWIEYEELLKFLEDIGLIRIRGKYVRPAGRRSYDYFYGVLSMIPEVKQYDVVERDSGDFIGLLDDFFVSEYCEPGARFIMAGRPWEVVSLTENTVYVKSIEDYRSAIPSWVGEEIPVPFHVAQEVGRIRGEVEKLAQKGLGLKEVAEVVSQKYGVSVKTVEKAILSVYCMAREGVPVPTHRRIVVEDAEGIIVVHAHFGNRVNRVLGKYLSYRISRLFGLPVYVSEKPYRILLRVEGVGMEEIEAILKDTTVEKFKKHLIAAVEESRIFRWRLQQVARKMGVIEPGTMLARGDVEKLAISLKDTPPYKEALKEVLYKDMDLENALKVVEKIEQGEIEVKPILGPTRLTLEHYRYLSEYLEPVSPEKRDMINLMMFKIRLFSSFISLACLECGYVWSSPVAELVERLECPACFSDRLAFDAVSEREMNLRLKKCKKGKGRGCRKFWSSVKALQSYGLGAILARAAGFSFRDVLKIAEGYDGNIDSFVKKLWIERKKRIIKEKSKS